MKQLVALFFFCFTLPLFGQDSITTHDVFSVEKLFDLHFTEAKRDSMLGDLTSRAKSYKAIHEIYIPANVIPAVLFNPIPAGMKLSKGKSAFTVKELKNVPLPQNFDDLAFYSVEQLASLIKARKITSEVLTKFFIDRLKKYGPVLHCVITITDSLALSQARRADKEISAGKYRGLLHGIPFGVKDLLAARNYPTTWGSVPYKEQIIDEDATVVKKLEQAGAVLAAKLSMGELAMDDVWFGGLTRNPWDTTKGSSGSSAGSASATSAGLLPFAIGSETWGSIVSPSTVCGTTGLRPSYGRVSRVGAMALSWSMDKLGPICRSAEDCAIVFNAIYGPDGIDPTVYDVPFVYEPQKINLKKLRIGFVKANFDSVKDGKQFNDSTLAFLQQLGATLVPIALPNLPVESISFILDAECSASFDELTRSGKDSLLVLQGKGNWPNIFRAGRFISATEYIQANRIRTILIQEMEKLFREKNIDLYVAPSLEGNNLLLTNLTGHPCVVLPNGFTDKGLPVSFSFTGKLFDEGMLLSVAKKYQEATSFHMKHPHVGSN
ncbi:MAG: amidase [Bacteroidota bacterium]|nr:amidase [Bacteroidota bacterium]